MESLTSKLLPCPFCGSDKVIIGEGSTFRWRVAHCECGVIGPDVRIQTMGNGTQAQWEAKAEADATAAWNTRAVVEPECACPHDRPITAGHAHDCPRKLRAADELPTAPASKEQRWKLSPWRFLEIRGQANTILSSMNINECVVLRDMIDESLPSEHRAADEPSDGYTVGQLRDYARTIMAGTTREGIYCGRDPRDLYSEMVEGPPPPPTEAPEIAARLDKADEFIAESRKEPSCSILSTDTEPSDARGDEQAKREQLADRLSWQQPVREDLDAAADIIRSTLDTSDASPVTQQEIVSAVYHHAREITRLTETWPAEPPSASDAILARNCLGNLFAAIQRFKGETLLADDADVQFAMREAAQFLGPPYTAVTKPARTCPEGAHTGAECMTVETSAPRVEDIGQKLVVSASRDLLARARSTLFVFTGEDFDMGDAAEATQLVTEIDRLLDLTSSGDTVSENSAT